MREGDPPGVRLTIRAGLGPAVSGEDVVLAQPVELDLRQLPVFAEPSVEVGLPADRCRGGAGSEAATAAGSHPASRWRR